MFAIVHGSSKEISSADWNSLKFQLDLFLVHCVSNTACVTQCLSVPSSCSQATECLRCHGGSIKSLVFLEFQCSWAVMMSEWCWGVKRSLLSCAMWSCPKSLGMEYCGCRGEYFPPVQRAGWNCSGLNPSGMSGCVWKEQPLGEEGGMKWRSDKMIMGFWWGLFLGAVRLKAECQLFRELLKPASIPSIFKKQPLQLLW